MIQYSEALTKFAIKYKTKNEGEIAKFILIFRKEYDKTHNSDTAYNNACMEYEKSLKTNNKYESAN